MDADTLIGTTLIVVCLSVSTLTIVWCRRVINRIARGRAQSAREIMRDVIRGR